MNACLCFFCHTKDIKDKWRPHMLKKLFEFIERNVEGFNFDPRKHSTITVYKNGQYCTYVLDKRTHQVLA